MKQFVTAAKQFVSKYVTREEEGATLAEYGLLLALIAVVSLSAIKLLGSHVSAMFSTIANSI
jgi:pilus assembly protein Flp/PilA